MATAAAQAQPAQATPSQANLPQAESAEPDAATCPVTAPGARLRPGSCVESALGGDDPQTDGIPFEEWQLPLNANETVQIELDALEAPSSPAVPEVVGPDGQSEAGMVPLQSFPFDAYLELRVAGEIEPVASNDDRPDQQFSLNSKIVFTAPLAGEYVIRARPLSPDEGRYRLRVSSAEPPPPPIRIEGTSGSVTIDSHSPEGTLPQMRSRTFLLGGVAGERVRIVPTTASQTLGMELSLGDSTTIASTYETSGTRSPLVAILPASGDYQLRVQVPSEILPMEVGVTIERRSASERPRRTQRIRVGQALPGDLGLDSDINLDPYGIGLVQSFSETFEVRLRAGEIVTVTVSSGQFDPVLDAGAMSPIGFASAARDDDGGDGFNSRLVLRPARAGKIYLRVGSVGNGVGAYQIRVDPGEPAIAGAADPPG